MLNALFGAVSGKTTNQGMLNRALDVETKALCSTSQDILVFVCLFLNLDTGAKHRNFALLE